MASSTLKSKELLGPVLQIPRFTTQYSSTPVLYTRFSSAGQKGNNSTDRQIEEGREWYAEQIAPLGIPLDESFTDTARSAFKGEHVGKKGDLGRRCDAVLKHFEDYSSCNLHAPIPL
jgi:hypothetical protein